jgi:UDP-glucose/GDP-mannose dehydrogenase family, UDP binding domain
MAELRYRPVATVLQAGGYFVNQPGLSAPVSLHGCRYQPASPCRVAEAAKPPENHLPQHAILSRPRTEGHCIPIDPFYLTWKAKEFERNTRFIELIGEINTSMPVHVVERVGEALNSFRKPLNRSRLLILGLAYQPNVDDERESPSYRIMELLRQRAAEVACDPHVPVIRPTCEHLQWAGTKSISWAGNDRRIRRRSHCYRARRCELSGTRRLDPMYRGHSERDGRRSSHSRKGLESVASAAPCCSGSRRHAHTRSEAHFVCRLSDRGTPTDQLSARLQQARPRPPH